MVYDERRELVTTYRAIPVTLSALIHRLDDARAGVARNASDWSVSEIVSHLLDSEQRTYERAIRIRDEDRPSLPYPAAWSRTGIHEREGELSILDIARHQAAHDAERLAAGCCPDRHSP